VSRWAAALCHGESTTTRSDCTQSSDTRLRIWARRSSNLFGYSATFLTLGAATLVAVIVFALGKPVRFVSGSTASFASCECRDCDAPIVGVRVEVTSLPSSGIVGGCVVADALGYSILILALRMTLAHCTISLC
jgi:hypothetical protein